MWKQFRKRKHLELWLETTDEGREITQSVIDKNAVREKANHVLAVVHADHVEIYGSPNVRVKHIEQLHCDSPAGEILSEELVELQLPVAYRELHEPRHRKAMLFPRTVRPSDYCASQWYWETVKGVLGAASLEKTQGTA